MKVLVIGKGGREHALCWRLNQSPDGVEALSAPAAIPGINQLAKPVPIAPNDFAGLADFARSEKIDLTVVGPEDPLAAGIVDEFDRAGLRIFGPTQAAAQLEASKAFAKPVMREAGVPTASFEVFDDAERGAPIGPRAWRPDGGQGGRSRARQGRHRLRRRRGALAAIDDAMERRRLRRGRRARRDRRAA